MPPLDVRSFRAALARGLGRCVQHLRSGQDVTEHHAALREAFLRTLAYDPQCEGTRLDYLLDLARAADMLDELRATALASLLVADIRWDVDQHVAVLVHHAREGDAEATAALRDGFASLALDDERFDSLAWAMVQLDGAEGLLTALRRLARHPERAEQRATGTYLRSLAADRVEPAVLAGALASAALREPDLAALLADTDPEQERAPRPPAPLQSLDELIETARSHQTRGARYRGAIAWGRRTSEENRQAAATALAAARDPWLQELLAQVWWATASPGPVDTLLSLADSEETHVSRAALRALRQVASVEVRALAWRWLDRAPVRWDALSLLARNHQPGDGERVMARLVAVPDEPHNADLRHEISLGLLNAFSSPERTDAVAPLRWLYEHSPCSRCRHDAVATLEDLGALTDALRAECALDGDPETRELARSGEPDADRGRLAR